MDKKFIYKTEERKSDALLCQRLILEIAKLKEIFYDLNDNDGISDNSKGFKDIRKKEREIQKLEKDIGKKYEDERKFRNKTY